MTPCTCTANYCNHQTPTNEYGIHLERLFERLDSHTYIPHHALYITLFALLNEYLCNLSTLGLFLLHSVASSSSTEPWYTSSDNNCTIIELVNVHVCLCCMHLISTCFPIQSHDAEHAYKLHAPILITLSADGLSASMHIYCACTRMYKEITNLKLDTAWREGLYPDGMKTLVGIVLDMHQQNVNHFYIHTGAREYMYTKHWCAYYTHSETGVDVISQRDRVSLY